MSASKSSTLEIPIAARWKISKEKLLAECNDESEPILSDGFVIEELSDVKYHIGIACGKIKEITKIGVCLVILMEQQLNIDVSCKFSIPSANKLSDKAGEVKKEKSHTYVSTIGTIEELFDPTNNFIVHDYLTVAMEAILTVEKEEFAATSNGEQPQCCKLGSKLWEREDKDFVIYVEGKKIRLHKAVISTGSSVFETMIQSGLQESKESKVIITDFDFETVESAVKFCYGFEESNIWTVENAVNLLQFSDKYDMNDLKTSVENFLSSQISPMNVCKLANAAILSNSIKLRENCFDFMLECNQEKVFVTYLEILDKDFALELMKATFSRSII